MILGMSCFQVLGTICTCMLTGSGQGKRAFVCEDVL